MSTIGERIKSTRLNSAHKMTQQELADMIGISRAAVAQWENGDSKSMKPENLLAAADALEVSIRWLITGKIKHYAIDHDGINENRIPTFSQDKMEALQILSSMPDDFASQVLPFLRFNAETHGKKRLTAA